MTNESNAKSLIDIGITTSLFNCILLPMSGEVNDEIKLQKYCYTHVLREREREGGRGEGERERPFIPL